MGLIKAFSGAISGTFADQWKDIVTADSFDEHTVMVPGILQRSNNGRGSNFYGSDGVLTNESKIFVPENTAAVIFNQAGIEEIITDAGGYQYDGGQESVFGGGGVVKSIFDQVKDRVAYGGQTSDQKYISFINLREIRDIKFGTKGALIYNDVYYKTDLEIRSFGSFSIRVTDAEKLIKNFIPSNTFYYSFDDIRVRNQILSEFIQSFTVALNSLSSNYRISVLPSKANEIAETVKSTDSNAGTWKERFGFEIVSVGIENIELTEQSKILVNQYSSNRMNLSAYDDITQNASNISAQQKIAEGVQEHGLGDSGMFFGMNLATNLNPKNASINEETQQSLPIEQQIELLKKLKELVDAEILTQEEFDVKKKEIMGTGK